MEDLYTHEYQGAVINLIVSIFNQEHRPKDECTLAEFKEWIEGVIRWKRTVLNYNMCNSDDPNDEGYGAMGHCDAELDVFKALYQVLFKTEMDADDDTNNYSFFIP